jgi:hypothetical protein
MRRNACVFVKFSVCLHVLGFSVLGCVVISVTQCIGTYSSVSYMWCERENQNSSF